MLSKALRKTLLQSIFCRSFLKSFRRSISVILQLDNVLNLFYKCTASQFFTYGWYSETVRHLTMDVNSWGNFFLMISLKINIKDPIFRQEFARGKNGWKLYTCQWCLGLWYSSMGTLSIFPTRRKQTTILNSIFLARQRSGKFHYSSVCLVLSIDNYTLNAKI